MKLNRSLRPLTLTVSATLATLLIAPALWPEVEKRFMGWAIPDDAALQARADLTARHGQDSGKTSLVHGTISGILAASSSAWEELPHGAAWPQITSFDLEFAHLEDTFRNASRCTLVRPPRKGFRAAGLGKDGLPEKTLLDPEFGTGFLAMDSPLVRKRGLAFRGSQSGGVDLSDEALRAYAANLLAALETSAEGSATWTSSDSLVSVSVSAGLVDGGSIVGSGYSTAISTPPAMQPPLVADVTAPQPQGGYGLVAAPLPVSESAAMWNGGSAGGLLLANSRTIIRISAPTPHAAAKSSVANHGVLHSRSVPFAAPLSTPAPTLLSALAPKVPPSFLTAPAPAGPRLQNPVGGSGPSTVSGNAGNVLTPTGMTSVHSQNPSGLTIIPTYDTSIVNDSQAATIEASIQTAINTLQSYIANPVTVNITFKEMSSGLAQSNSFVGTVSYANYLTALKNTQTRSSNDNIAIASLGSGTTNDPVTNNANIEVGVAPLEALGFTFSPVTNTILLNTSLMNLSRSGTPSPSKYDLQAAAAHEIDEVLGIGGPGSQLSAGGKAAGPVGPLDLYRYISNGVRTYSIAAGADPYFSINGGATNLVYFNQEGAADGADMADWGNGITGAKFGNSPAQVQDAYGTPGAQDNLGINELTALDVIGWDMTPAGLTVEGIPEPDSVVLLAGAAVTLLVVHRRRHTAAAWSCRIAANRDVRSLPATII